MVSNYNKNLWWENVVGKLLLGIGGFLLFWSILIIMTSLIIGSTKWFLITLPFLLIGGYLSIIGSQKRFNFKRNSGYIVYQGEK